MINILSADGTTSLQLVGTGFGMTTLFVNNKPTFPFPNPLGMDIAVCQNHDSYVGQWPGPFALTISVYQSCVSDSVDENNNAFAVNALCLRPNIVSHMDESITLRVPPGVGATSITISVYDLTQVQVDPRPLPYLQSNPLDFQYSPPAVTSIEPYFSLFDGSEDGFLSASVIVVGASFGNPPSAESGQTPWSSDASSIQVRINGMLCMSTRRTEDPTRILCGGIPPRLAGTYVVSVIRASEQSVTTAPWILGCAPGYYGEVGQTCEICPVGFVCAGYNATSNVHTDPVDPATGAIFIRPPISTGVAIALILGVSLGVGIPVLLCFICLSFKRREAFFTTIKYLKRVYRKKKEKSARGYEIGGAKGIRVNFDNDLDEDPLASKRRASSRNSKKIPKVQI
jgi:hypothetical protein